MMQSNNQAGKGDKPRPINKRVYDKNYDDIFRKKPKKVKNTKQE